MRRAEESSGPFGALLDAALRSGMRVANEATECVETTQGRG